MIPHIALDLLIRNFPHFSFHKKHISSNYCKIKVKMNLFQMDDFNPSHLRPETFQRPLERDFVRPTENGHDNFRASGMELVKLLRVSK